jgi:hypothetical protein
MALSRLQTVFTYQSSAGNEAYRYDIVLDAQNQTSVRNIRGPRGLITDSITQVPGTVAQEILDAMALVQLLVAESTITSGTQNFSGQTSRTVSLAGGLLNNVNYRVVTTSPDGTPLRIENKTTTSFDIVAASTYGSAADVKQVSWALLVSTVQASAFGGVLTYNAGDTTKSVAFPSAVASDDYRVLLEESDFFFARVENKTTTGFDVVISIDPDPGSVTVGYDVVL